MAGWCPRRAMETAQLSLRRWIAARGRTGARPDPTMPYSAASAAGSDSSASSSWPQTGLENR